MESIADLRALKMLKLNGMTTYAEYMDFYRAHIEELHIKALKRLSQYVFREIVRGLKRGY